MFRGYERVQVNTYLRHLLQPVKTKAQVLNQIKLDHDLNIVTQRHAAEV